MTTQTPFQPGQDAGSARPQSHLASAAAAAKPSTYWPLSIIVFPFSPLFSGIGMYFSAQVNKRWNAGDVEGATKASRKALIFDLVGIAICLLVVIATHH